MQKINKWVLIITILFSSCSTIIPEKDMVSILAKIYITDATVINSDLPRKYSEKDSIDYYGKAISSFGYSSAQFDSSLNYYSKDPKKLDKIYDKVITELLSLETNLTIEKDLLNKQDSSRQNSANSLWNVKTKWQIPEDGIDNHIFFKIPVKGFGTYNFSADVQVFQDDKSVKPRINIHFFYDDHTPTGNLSQIKQVELIQDGVMRNVRIQLELNDPMVTHVTGYLLDNGNDDGKVNKHVSISNIKFIYTPLSPVSKENVLKRVENTKRLKHKLIPE